jgi:hypothetical protein
MMKTMMRGRFIRERQSWGEDPISQVRVGAHNRCMSYQGVNPATGNNVDVLIFVESDLQKPAIGKP